MFNTDPLFDVEWGMTTIGTALVFLRFLNDFDFNMVPHRRVPRPHFRHLLLLFLPNLSLHFAITLLRDTVHRLGGLDRVLCHLRLLVRVKRVRTGREIGVRQWLLR